MGNFGRDDRSGGSYRGGFGRGGGRGGFGGGRRSSFGGDRGGDRQMFTATCSECGKECQVPFRPTGSKPVYCSECFEKMGNGRSHTPQVQSMPDLGAINAKLDKIINLLEPKTVEVVMPDLIVEEVKETKAPKAKKAVKKATSVKKEE